MRIIIAPARKMNPELDSLAPESLPRFLDRTERLKAALQAMTPGELQKLWKCNDAIAALNVERLRDMDLRRRLNPAVLAYEGIQYQYMAPGVFETGQFDYIREHLRILYGFWGSALADQLAAEIGLILNLASNEYSRAVKPHLPSTVRFLTCTFGELKDGNVIEKGVLCKMARGRMVRWLVENDVTAPENIKNFAELGYRYSSTHSAENNYVFIRRK